MNVSPSAAATGISPAHLKLLACPVTGEPLRQEGGFLIGGSGRCRYSVHPSGIPLFAQEHLSEEAVIQRAHYDRVSEDYLANLCYPHTEEYCGYLDRVLLEVARGATLGTVAEICCGRGEVFGLLGGRVGSGVGIDISLEMLKSARARHSDPRFLFVHGDAVSLPLAADSFDSVFMLGGIHHVNDRGRLFSEVRRVLKPGGRLFWREPVSDFFLWRWLRAVIYRVSDHLDSGTERPLRRAETVSALEAAGLAVRAWKTCGFVGFCLFMNSDVLVFNRLFRFVPGIRAITRAAARLDDWAVRLPGLSGAGLQVIGCAEKPPERPVDR